MDELVRLRQFRPAAAPSATARAQAMLALRTVVGGRRRRTPRPLIVVAAIITVAALATAAYAIYQSVIVGSPAPANVKNIVRLQTQVKGELIPQAHANPGIEVAKTRAAAAITTSVGPAYLWVAPNKRGDSCSYLQIVALDLPDGRPNLSGGCSSGGPGFYVGIHYIRVKNRPFALVQGRVGTKGAKTVELEFANGSSHSYPITDQYVLAETDPNNAIKTAIVRDAHGRVLAQRHYSNSLSPLQQGQQLLHRLHPIGPWRMVATLRTIGKHRLLAEKTAPGSNGTICSELVTPSGTGGGCNRPIGPTGLDIGPTQIGTAPHGWFLLDGPVGAKIHSLELRFEDGTHIAIPIQHGYILYQVNPQNFVSGHRPTELIARNTAGHIVNTRRFGFLR
ncbi:MAG: hypothetical protein QOI08_3680 [Actinomycetota bacterium]|nr:hypothetical protein [Actinomycetota bacterium]